MKPELEFIKTRDTLMSLTQADTERTMPCIEAQQLSCADQCMPGDWRDVKLNQLEKFQIRMHFLRGEVVDLAGVGTADILCRLKSANRASCGSNLDFATELYILELLLLQGDLVDVDGVGTVYIIPSRVYRSGARYKDDKRLTEHW